MSKENTAVSSGRKFLQKLSFAAVPDQRFRFLKSIQLVISVEGETIIAHSPELMVFGYGDNVTEALDDFGKTLGELHLSLREKRGRLSGALTRQLESVEQHLKFTER